MAKRRLKKFRGKIIGVTGSVGKTSTKDAIYTVLNSRFRVKRTKKNMNFDLGMLLTILDIDSGFSSATKWSWYILKAFFHSLFRDHTEILILEYGIERKGGMDFLTSVAKPDIAVITHISPVHLDEGQFKDVEEILEEKTKLAKSMREHGIAVLNIDNEWLASYAKKRGRKGTITYGKDKEADFWASQVKQSLEGLEFILHHDHKRYDVKANVIGEYQVYTILPAIICGTLMGIAIEDCIAAASRYVLPPGRMSVIPGIEGSVILDSSYNSSPEAMKEALKTLGAMAGERRKIAVIGNMNQLGGQSKVLHKMIGELVPEYADILLTVGAEAAVVAAAAKEKGMDESNVFCFKTSLDAADFLKSKIKKGDMILAKGSQDNVRMENLVKALMENPEDANKLLVRQEKIGLAKL